MRRTEAILPQSDIARHSPCVAILASGERGRQPFAKKTLANSEGKMADQPPLSQRSSHQKQQPIGSLSTVVKIKRTQTILNHTHTNHGSVVRLRAAMLQHMPAKVSDDENTKTMPDVANTKKSSVHSIMVENHTPSIRSCTPRHA